MSRREWQWIGVGLVCGVLWLLLTPPLEAIGGVLVGAVISGVISRYYYQQASNDLATEAEKLRKLHRATLSILPAISGGKVKVIWDEQGNFERLEYSMPTDDSIGVADSVQASTGSAEDGDPKP